MSGGNVCGGPESVVFSAVVDSPSATVAVFDITETVVSHVSATAPRPRIGRLVSVVICVENFGVFVEASGRCAGARTVAPNVVNTILSTAVSDYHRQNERKR